MKVTVRPAPMTALLRAETQPTAVRFVIDGVERTWAEHGAAIEAVGAWLSTEVEAGDRVAIFSANRVEWLEAAFGAQAVGAVMVPIYTSSTADQAAYVLSHCGAKVLFVDGEAQLERVLSRLSDLEDLQRIVLLDDGLDAFRVAKEVGAPAEMDRRLRSWSRVRQEGQDRLTAAPRCVRERAERLGDEHVAMMLYTSGTTGRPKGVPLTYQNIRANTEDWIEALSPAIPEAGVDLVWLPFSHIFGFGEIGLGNVLGFTSHLVTPAEVMEAMPRVRPSVFMSVPAYWEKIADLARATSFEAVTGGRLRFCLSGGAGLDQGVKALFLENDVLIIEGYGLTETSPTLTINRPGDFRLDSVGKPLSRVELRLAEDGEILARGPSVFGGYFRDEEATAGAFDEDGWFQTGDVGRFTEDGFLQIVDRKKDILVTAGGKNVPPRNIELLLEADPAIDRAIVYGDGKKYLVAGIWAAEAASAAHVQAAVERANLRLARHETIKRHRLLDPPLTVESGHLTPTLKPKRKRIYETFRTELEALYRD